MLIVDIRQTHISGQATMDYILLRAFLTVAREGNLTHAAALRHEVSGTLRIGTILDPEFLRLGSFLQQLVETYPRIETALRRGMSGWVFERVRSRDFDVGYYIGDLAADGSRDGERFHVVRLTPYAYRVLAPAGWHNRVNKSKRNWSALAKHPWIWKPPESAHNRLCCRASSARRMRSRPSSRKSIRSRRCSIS